MAWDVLGQAGTTSAHSRGAVRREMAPRSYAPELGRGTRRLRRPPRKARAGSEWTKRMRRRPGTPAPSRVFAALKG